MRFFVEGKEVTPEEKETIEKRNIEIFNSGKIEDFVDIRFIVTIND